MNKFQPTIEPKTWLPELEGKVFQEWIDRRIYRFDPKKKKRVFVIDTPPPYPSGRPWHIGAASQYAQIDMIARAARMMGYEVYFPIGIDRNGLPVELYVERTYGISIRETPREEFVDVCRKELDKLEAEMIAIMKMMGLSGDFESYYRTDSNLYRALTQETFIKQFNEGLIYEATRPNNYCSYCRTTIADAEVEYKDIPAKMAYVKFKVKETGEDLVVATTRPELLCSCMAVVVNPSDERYVKYHGLHAVVPIYGREVPIIPHPSARPDFGTGVVQVCSYGDFTDVQLFRELKLKEIIAISQEGRMTEEAGAYRGMEVKEAREKIIEDLGSQGILVKVEEAIHSVPHHERCNTPIEIIPMKDYYLKQLDVKEELKEVTKKIKFHPEIHRKLLIDWIDSLTIDWPISRRRYYATEIPVWYCKRCGHANLPEPGKYYRPWRDKPPFESCKNCGHNEFVGEERTFDTWYDSSISPLYVSKSFNGGAFFSKMYPNTIRPQGKDIVRTWLYYTILRCYRLTGKVPFKHAWIGGMGLDERGEAMSKSKGNVIDPYPVIKKYGADVFRFWSAQEASLGYDFRISESRIENAGKFLTKLWNVARFISCFPQPRKARLQTSDRWILSELSLLVNKCLKGYREFNFYIPANAIREFVWNIFASHYVEMVKPRAYGSGFTKDEQKASWYTLHKVLKNVLLLLAPITPFITEVIWNILYSKKSIHLQRFPRAVWGTGLSKYTDEIVKFNSRVWKEKKEKGISLKQPIEFDVPDTLKLFKKDLVAMHNLKKIK